MLRKLNIPSPTLSIGEALTGLAMPMDLERAERMCERLTGEPHAVLFASARGGLAAAAACMAGGRPVTIPAYTCIAVANAMRSAHVDHRFVDVSSDGTVPAGLWAQAGAQVALVQDTYGFPTDAPHGIPAIRDCAHRADLLQASDVAVAVTSFEHSKWLSSGRGGLAVTRDGDLAGRLRQVRDEHPNTGGHVRHGLSTLVLLLLGRLLFRGRLPHVAHVLAIAADILAPSAVAGQSIDELAGQGVGPELLGAPNGTACRLIVSQLRHIPRVGAHRKRIVAIYDDALGLHRQALPLVRYPLLVDDVDYFERTLAAAGWDAEGRWFDAPLHPGASQPEAFGYRYGSAPTAEWLAEHVVNLPTHPLLSEGDARRLIAAAIASGVRAVTRA